jgi:hypothetical protein
MLTGPQQEEADEWTVVESQYDIEKGQPPREVLEKDQVLVDTDWELERLIRHYEEAPGQEEHCALEKQICKEMLQGKI